MRVEDLSLFDLLALRETLGVLEKIGKLDPEARFDLRHPVTVTLPSLVGLMAAPGATYVGVYGEAPEQNTRGGLSPVAREVEAEAELPTSPSEVGASVPASVRCEPVAPAGEVALPAAPMAAAVPAGAGEQPAPAVHEAADPFPDDEPTDDLGRHLWFLTRKGDWHFGADHQLMDLACMGWNVPDIAAEMGRGDLDVKRRFDLLTDKRRFNRAAVRDRLAAFLALAGAAE